MNKIYIFGHQKPDTDTVTSAICLSYLKNRQGLNTEPRILGDINRETQFVLDYFKVKSPRYLDSVGLQIKDIDYHHNFFINEYKSLNETYEFLVKNQITAIPIVDKKNKLKGMVRTKEILKMVKCDDNYINTSYDNLLTVLNAKAIHHITDEIKGIVELKGNYLIIKENDKINLIITKEDSSLKKELFNNINIIKSSIGLYDIIKLLPWSNYVYNCINTDEVYKFSENDYYLEFASITNKLRHNNYPIVGKNNVCKGLVRLTDIKHKQKKQVILVDHNEPQQSVDGLEEADIIEIIDHHKIGTLPTSNPISFRNMIVGSTNTIIYQMFKENQIDIPYNIAGLMLSGILSDTLGLTSSTTTDIDKYVVSRLEEILSFNYQDYYLKMLKEGTSLEGRTKEDVFKSDLKYFQVNDLRYAIAQVITLDIDSILKEKEEYIKIINDYKQRKDLELVLLIVTDAIKHGSYLFYTGGVEEMISDIYKVNNIYQGVFINNLTSRKKQVVPYVNEYLK